jgi:hypothetical protein
MDKETTGSVKDILGSLLGGKGSNGPVIINIGDNGFAQGGEVEIESKPAKPEEPDEADEPEQKAKKEAKPTSSPKSLAKGLRSVLKESGRKGARIESLSDSLRR